MRSAEPHGSPALQVFYPKDDHSHPVQLDLLFRQVRACLASQPLVAARPTGVWISHLPSLLLGFGVLASSEDRELVCCTPCCGWAWRAPIPSKQAHGWSELMGPRDHPKIPCVDQETRA